MKYDMNLKILVASKDGLNELLAEEFRKIALPLPEIFVVFSEEAVMTSLDEHDVALVILDVDQIAPEKIVEKISRIDQGKKKETGLILLASNDTGISVWVLAVTYQVLAKPVETLLLINTIKRALNCECRCGI